MVPRDFQGLYDSGDEDDNKFVYLVKETLDVLESEDCNAVLQSCLDVAFSHVMKNVGAFFESDSAGRIIRTGNHTVSSSIWD
jgi:hypothetical protein